MAFDTTARLIAEAQAKLAELDSRVASYRHEMATEFTRYSEELLRDVPEDVAYQVSQAIANSILTSYPSLYPPSSLGPLSPSAENTTNLSEVSWNGNRSPPPILPHTSGTPKGQPTSPHDRELEFQGLFTPTYLPLLESVDRPLHLPPISPGQAPTTEKDVKLTSENTNTSEGTQTPDSNRRRRRPSPLRHATDTSVESTASDSSTARIRKSALRSSSASSRTASSPRDPRRVRFEFEGQEVLPSSSPQASTTPVAEFGSLSSGESITPTDDSPPVRSLADMEGEETPRPKKVSSSQALRALSKVPLDDQTTWTVVNSAATPEGSSAAGANKVGDRTSNNVPSEITIEHREMSSTQVPERFKEEASRRQGGGQANGTMDKAKPNMTKVETETEDESSDDESSLFMLSRKDSKKKTAPARNEVVSTSTSSKPDATQSTLPKAISTQPATAEAPTEPNEPKPISSAPVATSTTRSTATPTVPSERARAAAADEDEELDLFNLDADDDDFSLKKAISAQNSPKKHLREVPEEPEQNQKADEREDMFEPNAPIPASPSMSIPIRSPSEIPPKVLPMPQGSVPRVSIGSLGGRSLIMSPVKDPELLERIRKSDDAPPFFVGSVNGRSGPDASNVKSYVASLPSPRGMHGSFFERYIRERDTGTKYASDKEDSDSKT
ncbi:hypothetical protein VSDG_04497 [Cytospora chrysosperma]|uniref:Uncharacterized protein n=1 Tax=Cytospora chrysosperma TaxID=252740 RepID=A0A423W4H0_CYTCH|nr:hypothetical protein VSDG_04497 [Valsa sordida]